VKDELSLSRLLVLPDQEAAVSVKPCSLGEKGREYGMVAPVLVKVDGFLYRQKKQQSKTSEQKEGAKPLAA
jgi:hypothetical protein